MALLQMLPAPEKQGMEISDILKLIGMSQGMGSAGATPSMEGMMPPIGPSASMMPTPQGASMTPAIPPMGPPTQLQGLLNQPPNSLGLAPQGSPVTPMAAQIAMQPTMVNGIPVSNESTKFVNTGSTYMQKPMTQEQKLKMAQGVMGSGQQEESPQMQPLSRGQAAPMQAAQSPLASQQGGIYSQMLQKMISGYYG